MSITDELREYALGWDERNRVQRDLTAIADRIDAEHERAMAAAALIAGVPMTDKDMAEHGWIRLPKDADGEFIHVGDVVDVTQTDKFTGHKNVVVTSVIFKRSSALVTAATTDRPFTFRPNRIRHHHAPTVEDVLEEFVARWMDTHHDDIPALKAEYAAKLRLACDAE